MAGYYDHLTKAAQLKRRYHEECAAIRAEANLSDLGKARQLEQARERLAQQLAQLRTQYEDARAGEREAAHRRLFAPTYQGAMPTEATRAVVQQSYRDALARADVLPNGQAALRAYLRAQRSGDDLMCRALATVGWERGWQDVLNAHATSNEQARAALEQLVALDSAMGSSRVKMDERIAFGAPAVTPEEAQHRAELLRAKQQARYEQESERRAAGAAPLNAAINQQIREMRNSFGVSDQSGQQGGEG